MFSVCETDVGYFFLVYACLVACMSSIIRFSLVLEPLLMISNNDFESFSRCMSTPRRSACSNWSQRAKASSKSSANAMNSAKRTERVTLRDCNF